MANQIFEEKKTIFKESEDKIFEATLILTDTNSTQEQKSDSQQIIDDLDKLYNGTNQTLKEHLKNEKNFLSAKRTQLKKQEEENDGKNTMLWSVTNSLFVLGGMFGAFSSKYVLEIFGRKKGILFHYIFTVMGGILALIAPQFTSAFLSIGSIMTSRFLYGVQGGMMCGIIPTYLNEVAPAALRGSCGVVNQLCITIGILVAQTLGFRQLLGNRIFLYIFIYFLVNFSFKLL